MTPLTQTLIRWPKLFTTMVVMLAVISACGCEGASILAEAFTGRTIKAVFVPQDRPTLVLVDDPQMRLGDPSLPLYIASSIGLELQREKVITEVVPLEKLVALSSQLGEKYARTPVSRIGKQLGARQVIHVNIDVVDFGHDPGLLRPVAEAQVKLIDSDTGKRLFPQLEDAETTDVAALPSPGRVVRTELWFRHQDDERTLRAIRRKLADHIARDVARLFHDYHPRPTGEPYDD